VAFEKPLVITAGEPAGIGPELCLTLAHEPLPCGVVVVRAVSGVAELRWPPVFP